MKGIVMRKLGIGFLASVALLVSACVGAGPLPGEAVAAAAAKAREQGSAKVFMTVTTSARGQSVEIQGDGELDFTEELGRMTMTPSGPTPDMMGSMDIVFADAVGYMRIEGLAGFLPAGKEWIKLDFQALAEQQGIDFAQLQQLGQGDPSQQLNYLNGLRDVEEVGTEQVRGVATTHYSGTVDFDKIAQDVPEAAQSLERIQELSGVTTAPMDVWLDEEGLPRRVEYSFEMNPPATSSPAPPPGKTAMTIEYFDYGTDVTVEIPPASKVVDPSELGAPG